METKNCQNCKKDFTITLDDFSFYEKIKVPPPTWCWRCRAMRRMAFRNMTRLYPRVCDATGKKIFSFIPPTAPMPVYEHDYWSSDAWDPFVYGKEYDFSRSFFEQFKELYYSVPWTNVHAFGSTNSEYSSAIFSKNCYLCFDSGLSEDSAYSVTLQRSKQCFDIINCKNCELCYFTINTSKSYKALFSRNCTSCNDIWFCDDCVGCSNCLGCIGLRNKSYCIFNQQYTKESYEEKLKEMKLSSWLGIQESFNQAKSFWLTRPVKYQHSIQAQGCTGDYLFNVSQLRNCFFADNAQNCAHCQSIIYNPIKDCMDATSSGLNIQDCYEIVCSGEGLSNVCMSFDVMSLVDCRYCTNCRSGSNLFGCVGIRGKDYCILNKQYSKEEYNSLLAKIIKHMDDMPYIDDKGRVYKYGDFLPPEMSPYGYNVTQGQEYFPLTQESSHELGFNWEIPEQKNYKTTKTSGLLPDSIGEISDDILNEVIRCNHDEYNDHPYECSSGCATAFRIIPEELQFYRKMNLPLPRSCYQCRHFELISWRNKPALYPRTCMCSQSGHSHEGKCEVEFETSYAPDRPEIVYCEKCYQQEVV
jgi:hypothetical protein